MIKRFHVRCPLTLPTVLAFSLFLGAGSTGAQSVTRVSKSAVLADVSLGSGNNGFEDGDGILLGNNGTSNATDWRSFIRFDLPPLGLNTILTAKLRVYHQFQSSQNTGNVSIKALRITQNWTPPTSYNSAIYNLSTIDDGVAANVGGGVSGTVGSTMDTYVEFNVLPIVLAWQGGQPDYGISMRPANENLDYSFKVLTSSREEKQPELIIEYQTGGGPTSAPVVNGQSVTVDAMRFSVIAPDCIRIENSRRLAFVDGPTAVIRQRNLGAVAFTHSVSATHLTITTTKLSLKYKLGSNSLINPDLIIDWNAGNRSASWTGGQTDGQNLGGTRYDLDRVGRSDVPNFGVPTDIGTGLLSREGWHLLNDSDSMIWPDDGWMSHRGDDASLDYYFCAYGDDYKRMLQLFVDLSGRTPMVPNYTFGIWYSRYQNYTQSQFQAIVHRYRSEDIPFDVMGIDVDWHRHGWEGYDWNTSLIGNPAGMISYFKSKGVKSYLNSHPGGFMQTADTHWAPGKTAAGINTTAPYRFHFYEQAHVQATQSVNLRPTLQSSGVDFWWPDGGGRFSNFRTNFALATGKAYYEVPRQIDSNKRSLILNRYGGMGAQRYPIGFSGDTGATWQGLNYQPAFTARASNVAFPYWSHDIGGFDPYGYTVPDELYLRWAQFGVFSPVVRNHASHAPRLPWEYPNVLAQVKDIYQFRSRLFPYIYHYSRVVHDTGIGLLRPLYFEHPSNAEAYNYPYEYYFGADLLAAPVTAQSSGGVFNQNMWLPPGKWTDYWTGEVRTGPGSTVYAATLSQIPVYARPGAIIPHQPNMKFIGEIAADPLTLEIFPHAAGQLDFYEDDGVSMGYAAGQSTRTPIALSVPDVNGNYSVGIGPATGSFTGQFTNRVFILKLRKPGKPSQVLADSATLVESASALAWDAAASGWYFDASKSTTWVKLVRRNTNQSAKVQVQMSGENTQVDAPAFSPLPGNFATAQNVTISTSTQGSEIRYTTNGTDPTPSSGTVYSGPLPISSTTTLKAIAYQSGLSNSGVVSGVYTISSSLASDHASNYTTATWINGSNGGTGFGPWTIGANLGNQIADSIGNGGSPNINFSGDTAFRIARVSTNFVQASRNFTLGGPNPAQELGAGQSIRFSFDPEVPTTNNQAAGIWLTDSGSGERWGIEIGRTSGGVNQFRIKNNGTQINTTIPVADVDDGMNVTFNLLAAGAWTATIEMLGTGIAYQVSSADSGYSPLIQSPTGFRFFFANTPTGQSQYFNSFEVVATPPPGSLAPWRVLHGLAADGSQDLANPSGDGISNLLKYALNLAPAAGDLAKPNNRALANSTGITVADLTGLPVITISAGSQAVFTYIRRRDSSSPNISYTVEWGDGLSGWLPNSSATATTFPLDSTWERVAVRDSFTQGEKPVRFARLRINTL